MISYRTSHDVWTLPSTAIVNVLKH